MSDIFLLVVVRSTLRWIATRTNVFRIVLAILVQVSVFLFLVVVPLFAASVLFDISAGTILNQISGPQVLEYVAVLNVFTGLASILFLLALLFVLLNHFFWPGLSRLFYPVARYRLIRNKVLLFSVGVTCVVSALPWTKTFFTVIQSLLK